MIIKPGDRIRDNTIIRSLGSGGFGLVFEVSNPNQANSIALKICNDNASSEDLDRFLQENTILRRLHSPIKHEHIVFPLSENESENLYHYYLMELSEYNLEGFINTCFNLSVNQKLVLFKEICDGLKHAHNKGVVHRDLWWNNVLINQGPAPVVKLCDFGRAKDYSLEPLSYLDHPCLGHVNIRPPELFFHIHDDTDSDISRRGDLYALGILLSFLFNGYPTSYWPFLYGGIGTFLSQTNNTDIGNKTIDERKEIYRNWVAQAASHTYTNLHISLVDYDLTKSLNIIIEKLCNIDYSLRYGTVDEVEVCIESLIT